MKQITVGYIIPAFSTWVMAEVLEIKKNKVNVELFCIEDRLIPTKEIVKRVLSREARGVANDSNYLPAHLFPYLQAHLHYLIISPIKYFSIWVLLIRRLLMQLFLKNKRKQNFDLALFFKVPYLARLIQSKEILHVHSHFATRTTFAALLISKLTNIPFSFTVHDEIFLAPWDLNEEINCCSFIIAPSNYSKKYLIETYGESIGSKSIVIYCGVDTKKFQSQKIEKEREQLLVFSVAFLVSKKGFSYLVEACKILKKKGYEFQTFIAGDGPEKNNLKNLISKYNLGNIIRLLGMISQDELSLFLKKSTLFVLPAVIEEIKEGVVQDVIPVALIEAMAMGIPVISTNISGIPELIEHNKTGILVNERDAQSLAKAMELIMKNMKLKNDLGQAGQQKVLKMFSLQRNIKRKLELFRTHILSSSERNRT